MTSTLKVQNIAHTGGTNAMNINSSGVITTPNRPMFKIQRGANVQYGSAQNNTKITGFGDATSAGTVNVNNFWDTTNDRATMPVTGMYQFEFKAFFHTGTTGQIGVGLYVNGSSGTAKGGDYRYGRDTVSAGYDSVNVQWNLYLSANDFIEFYFIQHAGNAEMHLSSGNYYGGVVGYLIG